MTYNETTRAWYIRTKYGNAYFIHTDGAIERCDKQNYPSTSWMFKALMSVRGTTVATMETLADWYRLNEHADKDFMFYKNGKPKFTVKDCDHGTIRVWGNTDYHGIADLRPLRK